MAVKLVQVELNGEFKTLFSDPVDALVSGDLGDLESAGWLVAGDKVPLPDSGTGAFNIILVK